MKIKCERSNLYNGVQIVSRAVSGRSTLPILNNFLMEIKENKLKLTATDLEIGISCNVAATIESEGSITIPSRIFTEILSGLPESEISLSVDEKNIVNLKCNKSEYNIHGLGASEFPVLPEITVGVSFNLPQPLLRSMLRQTIFAASADEARAILTGALVEISGFTIKVVTTDTHRLAFRLAKIEETLEQELAVIVPSRALSELSRIIGGEAEEKVSVKVTENQIQFKSDDIVLISRLIEGQFPAYEKVIPEEYQRRFTCNREELLKAIRRASILAREDANKVILKLEEGKLVITSESAELGRAYEEMPIELEGESLEIAFNAKYLIDVLNATDTEQVYMELMGALNPGVVKFTKEKEYDYLYIVMPMQIL